MRVQDMTVTALLAALIAVSGSLKLPGILPGTEFQLSAPLAVAVCAVYGFRRYFLAGVLASLAMLLLGTQTIFNTTIALLFRLTVGAVLALGGTSFITVAIAGPIASFAARLTLMLVIGQAAWAVVFAAVPGMVYTAIAAWPLTLLLRRVRRETERAYEHVIQR
ncbi:MAG: hypothetical protein E6713_01915 [Sporomusaceae bacterium]|nr:hypothetical protein [Sporomusaceae bacterium]